MPLDSSIPLQSNAPDPMVSLNSMLDMGTKSLSLAKNRATFDADVARSKAESSTAESGAEVNRANIQPLIRQQAAQTSSAQSKASVDSQSIAGNVRRTNADASTAESGAAVGQGTIGSRIDQSTAAASTAQTGAQSAGVDLNTKRTQNSAQALQALISDPAITAKGSQYDPAKAVASIKRISAYAIETGQDPARVNATADRMISASGTEGGSSQVLRGIVQSMLTPNETVASANPQNTYPNNGKFQTPTAQNPYSAQFNADKNQARIVNDNGPNTETILPNGQKAVTGPPALQQGDQGFTPPTGNMPQGQRNLAIGRATEDIAALRREAAIPGKNADQMQTLSSEHAKAQVRLQQAQAMPADTDPRYPNAIPNTLPAGQADSIAATQKGINDHYRGLQDNAASSAQDIGVLQNIMSHAKGASTGIGSEKAAIAQAIFGKLGITKAQESSVDYDMLAKSSAMLALAGGNTDAAKSLATAANPNSHMSEEAIRQAAQQIIAQKKMTLEGLKIFQPLKDMSDRGHPEAYSAMIPKYSANADPKTIEFSSMTGPQREQFKSSMSPEKQKAFRAQMLMMESMGAKLHE